MTLLVNILVFVFLDPILTFMRVPDKVRPNMKIYLEIIFAGLIATSLYNYCSCMLRALGNSVAPLVFLGISSVVNIGLDLLFIAVFRMGVGGAAAATVIAQYISAIGILLYTIIKCREFLPGRDDRHYNPGILKEITKMSSLTCVQQSVMNFGILMVQGLVNSFGPVTMAALPPQSRLTRLRTCRYRISATHFRLLWHRITAPDSMKGSNAEPRKPSAFRWYSVSLFPRLYLFLQDSLWEYL